MNAHEFAAIAFSWEGVRWRHQARTRVSCDCAGLVVGSLAEGGVHIDARRDYSRLPMAELVAELEKHCTPAPGPAIGVMVSTRWPTQELPGHLAILGPPPPKVKSSSLYMVHAHMLARRVVINRFAPPWSDRVTGYWYAPGVDYG